MRLRADHAALSQASLIRQDMTPAAALEYLGMI